MKAIVNRERAAVECVHQDQLLEIQKKNAAAKSEKGWDLMEKKLQEIIEKERERLRGKLLIHVADSTCAASSGAEEVLKKFQELGKNKKNFQIVPVGCMGFCYCEPTIEICTPAGESHFYGNVTPQTAEKIFEALILEMEEEELNKDREISGEITVSENVLDEILKEFQENRIYPRPKEIRISLEQCGKIEPFSIGSSLYYGAYRALEKVLEESRPEEVVEIIKASGLRGRGGAGFPTGKKWELCAKNSGGGEAQKDKYVVCNGDEGDPGAFMDRVILESDPHSVLEAMAICGYAVGASHGIIYIRIEYPLAVETLEKAIEDAKNLGLLGKNIMGSDFSFEIEIKLGAGAFVCGEETALIHSMEGKRGEPTIKPPYPAEQGYLGCPTNVNNVETFAIVPKIINRGVEWFRSIGTRETPGTKVFSIVGKISKTGLAEVPMGTTLGEVIYEMGGGIKDGKKFKAAQTGGPSGGSLSEMDLDLPIDYETLTSAGTMMGSGGMIIMDESDCMVNIARFYLDFSRSESCGRCSPCRIGTTKLYELVSDIAEGRGTLEKLELIKELGNTVKRGSLCGLGRTAPNPVLSLMKKFPEEYLAHVEKKSCPAGVCEKLVRYLITEKCVGCGMCRKNCPVGAITGNLKERHVIDDKLCIRCGTCMGVCKFGAVERRGGI